MKSHHFPWLALRCARGLAGGPDVIAAVVGPVSALAADGSWHLNHLELQRPSPAQLGGAPPSYQGDGGRNSNIGGGNSKPGATASAGHHRHLVRQHGLELRHPKPPPAAGLFNEGLDILVPGRLIGFSVNAATQRRERPCPVRCWCAPVHPAAGTLTVVATPYTAPKGKAAALGYGKVFGKPGLLPNGAVPQLRLSFALLGTRMPRRASRCICCMTGWTPAIGGLCRRQRHHPQHRHRPRAPRRHRRSGRRPRDRPCPPAHARWAASGTMMEPRPQWVHLQHPRHDHQGLLERLRRAWLPLRRHAIQHPLLLRQRLRQVRRCHRLQHALWRQQGRNVRRLLGQQRLPNRPMSEPCVIRALLPRM